MSTGYNSARFFNYARKTGRSLFAGGVRILKFRYAQRRTYGHALQHAQLRGAQALKGPQAIGRIFEN